MTRSGSSFTLNPVDFSHILQKPCYFGLSPQRCPICEKKSNLLLCGGCKAVSYCGVAHQREHRSIHKAVCNEIKESREKLENEEAILRAKPSDAEFPQDVFTTGVGRFWNFVDTHDYMRARFAAAEALIKANTWLSHKVALEHLMDMLRLDRKDNMGARRIIPVLMMRLIQHQECYDFLKWWATYDADGKYDWDDTSLPYLNIRNADVFESIDSFRLENLSLSQKSMLTLLKLSLHLDLRHLILKEQGQLPPYCTSSDDALPEDQLGILRRAGKIATAWMARPENKGNFFKASEMETRLADQFRKLADMMYKDNTYFWETLFDDNSPAKPASYTLGSPEEASLVVGYVHAVWKESRDAMNVIRENTLQYISEYLGPSVCLDTADNNTPSVSSPGSTSNSLPVRRGTGQVFPTVFNPPSPTTTPGDMFTQGKSARQKIFQLACVDNPKMIAVFTDGACSNNGHANPRAGWAVVHAPGYRISGRLEDKGPFGEEQVQSSNRAELRAVIAALRLRDYRNDGVEALVIATDSSYCVDGATSWVQGWVRNGWKTRTGEPVKNMDLWEALLGEIDRCNERGLAVLFWRISRDLNKEADDAAKDAIKSDPIENFRDLTLGTFGSGSTDNRPLGKYRLVALCLEDEIAFNSIHQHLINGINGKRAVERVRTPEQAIKALTNGREIPSIILATDAAITHERKVFERVADCLRAGSTVVLCGNFSAVTNWTELNRLCRKLGLPWIWGSYYRTHTILCREAVDSQVASRLPAIYSQKALYLEGVKKSDIWYTDFPTSGQAAAAMAKVGEGKFGYVGDVNGEDETTAVVLGMCGLLD